jgi:hypothetical protein
VGRLLPDLAFLRECAPVEPLYLVWFTRVTGGLKLNLKHGIMLFECWFAVVCLDFIVRDVEIGKLVAKKYLVLPTNSSAVCREWSAKFELPILSNGLRTSCLSVLSVLVRTFAEFVYFVFRFIYWTWEDNTPF